VTSPGAPQREVGLRLIILYKAVKAVVQLALAATLVALAAAGEMEWFRELARGMREHVASRWSVELGRIITALTSPRGLRLTELALLLDGSLTAVEGYALWRGYRWGAWLVVIASGLPLPLEVHAILRTHRASRVALAVVNAAVVVYLARRIARRHSEHKSHEHGSA
jgi:uncharacterized membrane protein (DUF2068 family)